MLHFLSDLVVLRDLALASLVKPLDVLEVLAASGSVTGFPDLDPGTAIKILDLVAPAVARLAALLDVPRVLVRKPYVVLGLSEDVAGRHGLDFGPALVER